jgi:hypothetical protein
MRALAVLLALLRARDAVHFFRELHVVGARLADLFDLLEDFGLSILDDLVGDLLVAEDHQFADRSFAGAKLIADDEDALGNGRRAGD